MKIKICGLFRAQDIDFVNEYQCDYAGFVFAKSKRQIDFAKAAVLRKALAPSIIPVGVFVNAPKNDIASLYKDGTISIAQLHGAEDAAYISELKKLCGVPVIKSVCPEAVEYGGADYLLFDNKDAGSGQTFDWTVLKSSLPLPWFLAGGITIENIQQAISLNPYCIDVSSGAETNGVKDPQKIERLIQSVKIL
jgi:phosphoribosylanthranilate isomerase